MTHQADVAVVGGGILGLAHAWAAARRGHSVVLFERDRRAQGASIRNFGMIWLIGQPPGVLLQRARLSRSAWLELAALAGIWLDPCGSLHLAYRDDEQAVLEEFSAQAPSLGYDCQLLTSDEALRHCPSLRRQGLRAALQSRTDACVDPRQAIAHIPEWLRQTYRVDLRFGATVRVVEPPHVQTTEGQVWKVDRVVVCSGIDFQTLFPEVFARSGIIVCKLQMMRTAPQPGGWRIGTMLAGGLTLGHYAAFGVCPSLPRLRQRIREELPEYVRHGIHVMASQNQLGEVVIGDSHEYGEGIEPFDKTEIDRLILDYLGGMVELPDPTVAQRWHGMYARHPSEPLFVAEPFPRVHIVNAPGGAGMTLSFGIAEEQWRAWEGEIRG